MLIQNPTVGQWIKGDLSFLNRKEDVFKNKTAEKDEKYIRENNWAWGLFCSSLPSHGYKQSGKWSGKFGQLILQEMIPGGWKPKKKKEDNRQKGIELDWEDENYVYELKTQFHLSGGTAQEKIIAVPIKYVDAPKLFGKPMRIVCFAGAEGYAKEFLTDCPQIRQQLDLWKSWGIEYIWGSDLIKDTPP